mmetsp:Transcript_44252/g.136593  ORF Transcript_44252/g.136593 Transcript_44252/m.136593 type:complete len:255 (+) Transcript_44252:8-772(+)
MTDARVSRRSAQSQLMDDPGITACAVIASDVKLPITFLPASVNFAKKASRRPQRVSTAASCGATHHIARVMASADAIFRGSDFATARNLRTLGRSFGRIPEKRSLRLVNDTAVAPQLAAASLKVRTRFINSGRCDSSAEGLELIVAIALSTDKRIGINDCATKCRRSSVQASTVGWSGGASLDFAKSASRSASHSASRFVFDSLVMRSFMMASVVSSSAGVPSSKRDAKSHSVTRGVHSACRAAASRWFRSFFS